MTATRWLSMVASLPCKQKLAGNKASSCVATERSLGEPCPPNSGATGKLDRRISKNIGQHPDRFHRGPLGRGVGASAVRPNITRECQLP
jgi:hypothetical protein